ncbi:cytochrome c biogenesis protein [Paraoerskovia marina]|uniref:Cytochrome c biogenesis protein n=1 Tax=Paraoerskovia marina TaxID=545619 RepID=A0A1H1VKN9_9CELL|nr:cytochrome c biogenesis protein ResB [Paraoerskovia marina]SDS85090.1 cytochrome c biogenesis protein [Paraoerskovia marina]
MARTPYRPEGIDDAFSTGESSSARPDGSAPAPAARPTAPAIGVRGMLRWMWRQLTSMRVALLLLMLLAVAAVPGSVLPQTSQDAAAVAAYLVDHPTTGPWLEAAGFFDVYSSVWFSAIYLLLFVSLVGCILPRTAAHWRALRGRPPRTPRRFARFPAQATGTSSAAPEAVADAAVLHLRGRRRVLPIFRVERGEEPATANRPATATVAAERGYLRESGNLLFHLALLGLLVSVATGQMLHYRGQAILVEERGFGNSVVDYDTFENGALFDPTSLEAFTMTLDRFESEFDAVGTPRDFTAYVTVTEPGGEPTSETIKVNHPLDAGDAKIYLQGNGYAPDVTVRDADGEVAFAGPVPFIPEDQVYTSRGVIKVPDVSPGLEQIGFVGYLLPTAVMEDGGARSVYPQPGNPQLVLDVYTGDLGLDEGVPQNVYSLDTDDMTPSTEEDGTPTTIVLGVGDTVNLPDGGSITFEDLPRYVALDLRHDPALGFILTFSLLALGGLAVSLFTPRRRVWLRTWAEDGRTVVEVAGLARHDDAGLQGQVDDLLADLPGIGAGDGDTSSDDTSSDDTTTNGEADGPAPRKADR